MIISWIQKINKYTVRYIHPLIRAIFIVPDWMINFQFLKTHRSQQAVLDKFCSLNSYNLPSKELTEISIHAHCRVHTLEQTIMFVYRENADQMYIVQYTGRGMVEGKPVESKFVRLEPTFYQLHLSLSSFAPLISWSQSDNNLHDLNFCSSPAVCCAFCPLLFFLYSSTFHISHVHASVCTFLHWFVLQLY